MLLGLFRYLLYHHLFEDLDYYFGSMLVSLVKTSGLYRILLSLSSFYDERLSLRFIVHLHENT